MAWVLTGDCRSLTVIVSKKINGILQYHRTYYGQDNSSGFLTAYPLYPALTDEELGRLSEVDYLTRLVDFETWVEGIEAGLDFDTATILVEAELVGCPECTTTTTTIPPTTTTTTTLIPCDTPVTHNGGVLYPGIYPINIGEGLGKVDVYFDTYGIPDRYIVEFDGNVVIDTGYLGKTRFDFGGVSRNWFNFYLTGRIDPISLSAYPDFVTYPDDGYPRVSYPYTVIECFDKNSATEDVTVYVYAPEDSTAWTFTVNCPDDESVCNTTTTTIP